MALAAPVVNGELVYNTTQTTNSGSIISEDKSKNNSTLDKEAFLQLLVAEMQYQDPLEPTTNTEYISQFATFSSLEQMQNMSSTMELQRGTSLVGQYVLINSTNEKTGAATSVLGKVDYVYYENSKAFLHVNGNDYPLDDLDTVVDESYYTATQLASDVSEALAKLPTIGNLTISSRTDVENLRNVYNDMNSYQKEFLGEDTVKKLEEYFAKMDELIKIEDAKKESNEKSEKSDNSEGNNE